MDRIQNRREREVNRRESLYVDRILKELNTCFQQIERARSGFFNTPHQVCKKLIAIMAQGLALNSFFPHLSHITWLEDLDLIAKIIDKGQQMMHKDIEKTRRFFSFMRIIASQFKQAN